MDYPFENLNPESFQKFCQALITREFSETQCFPVAQPDGGRDATACFFDFQRRGFIVYQVKFVRKPSTEESPHQWLLKIMDQEAPKVSNLIPKGAEKYVLITNVQGTAHPETGSIDKMSNLLTSKMGIPSICWWRDDICRRLDNAWDLKWVYPELMTGPDLIRVEFFFILT
jgi:hypothetical protein